jgi:hypothetical protein
MKQNEIIVVQCAVVRQTCETCEESFLIKHSFITEDEIKAGHVFVFWAKSTPLP